MAARRFWARQAAGRRRQQGNWRVLGELLVQMDAFSG